MSVLALELTGDGPIGSIFLRVFCDCDFDIFLARRLAPGDHADPLLQRLCSHPDIGAYVSVRQNGVTNTRTQQFCAVPAVFYGREPSGHHTPPSAA